MTPIVLEGVEIKNRVVINSYQGGLATDRGSWAAATAEALHREHSYCTKHESKGILAAGAGLAGELKTDFMNDMYAMIYDVRSAEELNSKVTECLLKYEHHDAAKSYISTLFNLKEKLCVAYTQYLFTFLHQSTQRSEGFNNKIKGQTDLKDLLSDFDLVELHEHLQHLCLLNDKKAMNYLIKLRKRERQWSDWYEKFVRKSMELALHIDTCEKIPGSEDSFRLTRYDGTFTEVNLSTKVVHLGVIYTIPTCGTDSCRPCGWWSSSFRMCRCIAKALAVNKRPVLSVENVHPIHLIRLHPMWPTALRKCKRDDYKNASNVQVDGSKYFWLYHFVKTAHLMLIVNLPYSSSDDSNNASLSTNCPNEFYQMLKKVGSCHCSLQ